MITVKQTGQPVRCDKVGCRGLVGVVLDGRLHVRAGKQIVIAKDVAVTCPNCGHMHFLGVAEK